MFVFAVDWDGTCVTEAWPDMGDWLPGAVEGLHLLSRLGKVVIFSSRVAPWEYDNHAQWLQRRDILDVAAEVSAMRRMLRKRELEHIEVWTRDFKPPALAYIDNRGFRFTGDWGAVVDFATAEIERETGRPIEEVIKQ